MLKAGAIENPVILMPVFNDWDSLGVLLRLLDGVLAETQFRPTVVVVDDGSSAPQPSLPSAFRAIVDVVTLTLKRNVGHQRAIAIGLSYIHEQHPCTAVVVMDSDGEDCPADVLRLLDQSAATPETIMFARRRRRSEPIWFRICYMLYRAVFYAMTGRTIHFGNFSVVPAGLLGRVAAVSEIWNHYSAGIMNARIPFKEIDTIRGVRLSGKSSMRLTSLVTHGLSSMAVFSEVVGTRLSLAAIAGGMLVIVAVLAVVGIRLFTNLAIPGWATYAVGLLVLILLQVTMFCFVFLFLVLSGRNSITFIPERDHSWFILRVTRASAATWAVSNT